MAKAALQDRIKQAREAKELSQADLAEKLQIDKTTVSHWELGIAAPRRTRLGHVSKVLEIPLDELHRLYIEFKPARKAS